MSQISPSFCNCCGLPIGPGMGDDCPRCSYPINPRKETHFLRASVYDLQRVATYGGAQLRVVDLLWRYNLRLEELLRPAPAVSKVAQPAPMPAQPQPAAPTPEQSAATSTRRATTAPLNAADAPPATPHSTRVFAHGALFADQAINIVAALGAFLILIGSLSFTVTTSSLLLSFLVLFAVHAVFGTVGAITHRVVSFRIVSTIYTLIFALLVPLVTFSAYRLLSGSHVQFSVSVLIALAALYAAIVYILLAIYQRFVLFAYLGLVALVVADLATASAWHLALWWWPGTLLLLAFPMLISLPQSPDPAGLWPLKGPAMILRSPMRLVMYMIVIIASLPGLLLITNFVFPNYGAFTEIRLSLFCLSLLLFVWLCLAFRITHRKRTLLILAWSFLITILTACYALNFSSTGYVLALTATALLYHILARYLQRGFPALPTLPVQLDLLALGLICLSALITAPLLPFQLYANVYGANYRLAFLIFPALTWQTLAGITAGLVGVGLTISISLAQAGYARSPLKPAWCGLLFLSGLLLYDAYTQGVLALRGSPLWFFLALAFVLVAGAVLLRRFVSAVWANPLDLLALFGLLLTLSLGLNRNPDLISALLLSFALLLYAILFYQQRPAWLAVPLAFALLALFPLWQRPLVILGLGICLPLLVGALHWLTSTRRAGSENALLTQLPRSYRWNWPVLLAGLIYGVAFAANVTQGVPISNFTSALELALLAMTWYLTAALMRQEPFLVVTLGFAVVALMISNASFGFLAGLTPLLALAGLGISLTTSRHWAAPLYLVALLAAYLTCQAGLVQGDVVATTWALLGFGVLVYLIGILERALEAQLLLPIFTTVSVYLSASQLGDLYRPPLMALLCAALGIAIALLGHLPFMQTERPRRFLLSALPLYMAALLAAILTGVYGTLAGINHPFIGAIPAALLIYALVALAILRIEKAPRWTWLIAAFALWGAWLTSQLPLVFLLALGLAAALLGLLGGFSPRQTPGQPTPSKDYAWSWPWYATAIAAALLTGSLGWPAGQLLLPNLPAYSLLAFAATACVVMLVERRPALLLFPTGLAIWAILRWDPVLSAVMLTAALSLLWVLVFVSQFLWRVIPPVTRRLSATTFVSVFALCGQALVVFSVVLEGGLASNAGTLTHAGAASLLELALLFFWYALLVPGSLGSATPSNPHQQVEQALQRACYYITGFLLSLVVSWELIAFQQTRFDILTLVPASYLIVIAPFLMRDEKLPERHWVGQTAALLGAALLLLPALWFSFNDLNLLPTLILVGEALALLLLGILTRVRIFVLSSASLLIVGALRALFLAAPPSLTLMGLGGFMVLLATTLFLVRHRLKLAWSQWD